MPPTMKPVYSDSVRAIGHDPATGELHVTWANSGRTSVYSGVPAELAHQASNAWSVGKAVQEIKSNPEYGHRYLGEDGE